MPDLQAEEKHTIDLMTLPNPNMSIARNRVVKVGPCRDLCKERAWVSRQRTEIEIVNGRCDELEESVSLGRLMIYY